MNKIRLEQISEFVKEKIDVFLCSASFEDRCFSIPKMISKRDIQNSVVFNVTDLDYKIAENADKLTAILGPASRRFELQIGDPAFSLKSMGVALNSVISKDKPQTYLLDITTFTHEGLLMLFKLLQLRLKPNDNLFLCYNGAKEYSCKEINPDDKWLSKGVNTVRSILGYPGLLDPSKKNHLIILFGFESERTSRLIDIYDYDLVSLAFGSKGASIAEEHQKLNETRHEALLRHYVAVQKFEISLVDAEETKNQLLSYIKEYSDYNTVIAPMNTKISSIGASLAAINNPEIQLCYVTANQYNIEGYSQPSDYCYIFKLGFNGSREQHCNESAPKLQGI